MAPNEEERAEAHAELAKERWEAHAEKHLAEKELAEQYRQSHAEQHTSIARNLTEYKAQSNEWRASLSDMRSSFVTNAEIKSLLGQAESTHIAIGTKVEALDKRLDAEREERRDQYTLRAGQEQGISRTTAVMVVAVGLIGTLLGGLAVLLNILKVQG